MNLDTLKQNWQRTTFDNDNYEKIDFIQSFHKKSISITKFVTKRLFIFSLLEFVFWGAINICFQIYFKEYEPESFTELPFLRYIDRLNYVVLGGFVATFLAVYNKIDLSMSVKQLMNRILFTKSIVNYYIKYNIALFVITFLVSFTWELYNNVEVMEILKKEGLFFHFSIIVFGVVLSLLLAFIIYKTYNFIYGRFIKDFVDISSNLKNLD
ncbi:MAG: hypothetical protein R2819_11705 [Allomuricauda sp.]